MGALGAERGAFGTPPAPKRIFLLPPHGPLGRGEGGERGVGPFRPTFRAFNCVTPIRDMRGELYLRTSNERAA